MKMKNKKGSFICLICSLVLVLALLCGCSGMPSLASHLVAIQDALYEKQDAYDNLAKVLIAYDGAVFTTEYKVINVDEERSSVEKSDMDIGEIEKAFASFCPYSVMEDPDIIVGDLDGMFSHDIVCIRECRQLGNDTGNSFYYVYLVYTDSPWSEKDKEIGMESLTTNWYSFSVLDER